MARNIEIKARVRDATDLAARAAAISDTPPRVLIQHDRFYGSPNGRLKLRWISGDVPDQAELIYYQRSNQTGPKLADYQRIAINEADQLDTLLTAMLGVVGEVRKTRRLYLCGQTRIHLDRVAGLGEFMELEVVLCEHQSDTEGEAIVCELMRQLQIMPEDLLAGAYLDLLRDQSDP